MEVILMDNTKTLVNILDKSIDKLKEKREYFKNEKSDFTRKRKLNFEKIINLLMCMESGSLKDELYNYFDLNINNDNSFQYHILVVNLYSQSIVLFLLYHYVLPYKIDYHLTFPQILNVYILSFQ